MEEMVCGMTDMYEYLTSTSSYEYNVLVGLVPSPLFMAHTYMYPNYMFLFFTRII